MAENKDYKTKSIKELEELAKASHKMTFKERLEEVQALLKGADSDKVKAELSKPLIKLDHQKLGGLYEKLHGEYEKKGELLEDTAADEWLKTFAGEVLPSIGLGAKGYDTDNLVNLENYLSTYDSLHREQGERSNIRAEVTKAIKEGHGLRAVSKILDAIHLVRSARIRGNLRQKIVPSDHIEFRDQAATYLEGEITKELKDSPYKIKPEAIRENIIDVIIRYADRGAAGFADSKYTIKPSKKHKKVLEGKN